MDGYFHRFTMPESVKTGLEISNEMCTVLHKHYLQNGGEEADEQLMVTPFGNVVMNTATAIRLYAAQLGCGWPGPYKNKLEEKLAHPPETEWDNSYRAMVWAMILDKLKYL